MINLRQFIERVDYQIEAAILIIIVLLNIFDFFKMLPPEIDYIKKIISWTVLGYLLYQAGITDILFGYSIKKYDALIITGYFLLIFNKFINYSIVFVKDHLSREKGKSILLPFHKMIATNAGIIELTFFVIGIAILLFCTYMITKNRLYGSPSVIEIFGNIKNGQLYFMITFIILISFFIMFFNLFMEWLAIAVDAPLMIAGIIFYLLFAKKFDVETYIYKLGDLGDSFYKEFIRLFHSRKTILIGISGMLVLHAITDVGIYLLPYLTGLQDPLYFSHLGNGHVDIHELFNYEIIADATEAVKVASIYIINCFALLLLLIGPGIVWYFMYRSEPLPLPNLLLSLFYGSIIVFFTLPIFKIGSIRNGQLLGSDILTKTVTDQLLYQYSSIILGIAIGVSILVFMLTYVPLLKAMINYLWFLITYLFFGYYIYNYSSSVIVYYLNTIIINKVTLLSLFSTAIFSVFLFVSCFFYISAYIFMLVKVIRG
jgi:hypothetical protein